MDALHQLVMRLADFVGRGTRLQPEDLVGLLIRIGGSTLRSACGLEVVAPAGTVLVEPRLEQREAVGIGRHLSQQLPRFFFAQLHQIGALEGAGDHPSLDRARIVVERHRDETALDRRGIVFAERRALEREAADAPVAEDHKGQRAGERGDANLPAEDQEGRERRQGAADAPARPARHPAHIGLAQHLVQHHERDQRAAADEDVLHQPSCSSSSRANGPCCSVSACRPPVA